MCNRRQHGVLRAFDRANARTNWRCGVLVMGLGLGVALGLPSLTGCQSVKKTLTTPNSRKLVEQGDAAYRQGDYATAISYYEQAAAIRPGSKLMQYNLGQARLQLNQPVAAELAFRNGLSISYDEPYWRLRFQDAMAEALYRQTGQQDQLFSFLQDQVDTYGLPQDSKRQGDYLYRMGDPDNARLAYEHAAKLSAVNDASYLVALGDFYRVVGDDEHARLVYRYAYWVNPAFEGLNNKLRQTGYFPGPTAGIEPPAELKPSGAPLAEETPRRG